MMVKLLIIADDFTGALDTGVQFAASGAETRVVTNRGYNFSDVKESVQVLVLDAETRHLSPEKAYEVVFAVTKRAYRDGIPFIYKKTDSALRGNIGSELRAVLDATGRSSLHFLPAFPKMNRVTKKGMHYIDGILVHESVFGSDPFEPVSSSYIPEIIQEQAEVTVVETLEDWKPVPGVMVYDAIGDEDLREKGQFLLEHDELHIMAGCAGFAGVLPALLGLEGAMRKEVKLRDRLLIACGSVNPITRCQLDYAEQHGFTRIAMTPEQKLKEPFYQTAEGQRFLRKWKAAAEENRFCIIDTNDPPGSSETLEYAKAQGITLEELRVQISSTLGYILKKLLNMGLSSTILITGGDCLLGFMKHIGCDTIAPVCEMDPGTVLSEIELQGRTVTVISKSGGFGDKNLLTDLAEKMSGKLEEKVC